MKRNFILFLFLLSFLLIAVTSCASNTANTTAPVTSLITTEDTKEPIMSTTPATTTPLTEAPKPTTVTIDQSFTLICSSSASTAEKAVADRIVTAMSHFGITLSVANDSQAQTGNEIIVGNTSRQESQTALQSLSAGEYSLAVFENASGVSLVVAAADDTGYELAANHLIINYLTLDNKATLPYDLSITHKKANVAVNESVQLSDYVVVYAKEGTMSDVNIQCAKYADAAQDFAKLVEKFTGYTLTVLPDTADLSSYEHLILFGNTARLEDNIVYSASFYQRGHKVYNARILSNGNIAIAGNNPISAYAAGEAFLSAIAENNNTITELNVAGEKDIIRVACLGDSITYGTGSADPSVHSYPVYYQRMLGYNYYVEKYGAPSNSLIETDTPSYLNHSYFQTSAEGKPDVVIVMLGTNDTRPTRWADSAYKVWNAERKQAFLDAGDKLVANYKNANPNVQIIFATCPYVPQAADWTGNLQMYGNPHIEKIAQANNCPVIDIFTYTKKNLQMYAGGDGLHLKDEKYEMLAQGFYELTKDIIKK